MTGYTYDRLNRLTEVVDAQGGTTTFAYDPNGNLLSVIDARNSQTTYTSMDRLETRTDPLQHTESYGYDPNGNLSPITDRKGQVRMTFEKLLQELPNGLHDAALLRLHVDWAAGTAQLDVLVEVGRVDEGSRKCARIVFSDLQFLAIDPPDVSQTGPGTTWIDAGPGQPSTAPLEIPPLREGFFLCWVYASGWNSFIRIAARDVALEWGAP
jgi:YD repeat-containing protein